MEGGSPPATATKLHPLWPGVLAGVALTIGSYAAARVSPVFEPIVMAMLLGLVVSNLLTSTGLAHGAAVLVKKVLPLGVVLLGARLDFFNVVRVGANAAWMSVAVVLLGLLLVYGLRGLWGLEHSFALLLAVGTAICGGTAIVAVAPLLAARDRDIVLGVSVVTGVGLAAMLALPALAGALHLTQAQFGVLAGLTIHQTPQVVAAGFAYGDVAGQTATVVKLTRVCMLAPVALLLGWWAARRDLPGAVGGKAKRWWQLLPGFALGFLLMALARTLGVFPEVQMQWPALKLATGSALNASTADVLKEASAFLLALGMAGVGFQTRLSQFKGVGWRPIVAGTASSALIAALVLLAVRHLVP